MIALDTNVLLRFLLEDDPAQLSRTKELLRMHQAGRGEAPQLFVAPVVVCELVWVLESVYRHPKSAVLAVLEGLLSSRDIEIGDRDGVKSASVGFRDGKGGFTDYYIRESSLRAGCESVATFDRALLKEDGFRPV